MYTHNKTGGKIVQSSRSASFEISTKGLCCLMCISLMQFKVPTFTIKPISPISPISTAFPLITKSKERWCSGIKIYNLNV